MQFMHAHSQIHMSSHLHLLAYTQNASASLEKIYNNRVPSGHCLPLMKNNIAGAKLGRRNVLGCVF